MIKPESPKLPNSPAIVQRKLEHAIEVEEKEYDDTWRSCCGSQIDRRCVVYAMQSSIMLIIIGFCIFKLTTSLDCTETSTYLSLMMFILGIALPCPKVQ